MHSQIHWPNHIVEKARKSLVIFGYAKGPNSEELIMNGFGDGWTAFHIACIAAATEEELDKYMPNRIDPKVPSKIKTFNAKLDIAKEKLVKKSREITDGL